MGTTFERRGSSEVLSQDGLLHISRVGLSLRYRGQQYEVDSEMLDPPMSIAVYFRTSDAAKAKEAEQIREFIAGALTFRGFTIEFL